MSTINANTPTTMPTDSVQNDKKTQSPTQIKVPSASESKQQLNAQIIDGLNVTLNSKNQPLSMLYSAAVDKINEILNQAAGNTGANTQNILEQKLAEDNSAEATAERILSFALGSFQRYAEQNPNLEGEALAERFVNVMRGGFEKGYNEAVDILKSLEVFNGDIESDISKTYDLVSKGFDDFLASFKKQTEQTTTE